MKVLLVAIFIGLCGLSLAACQSASLKRWPPQLSDYPILSEKYTQAKDVDLQSYPKARMMRTRLKEAFKKPADLANNYVVMRHGCGTQCLVSWVVNKKNGKVLGSMQSDYGLNYALDSRLIVANPNPAPCKKEDQGYCDFYKRHKYQETYYLIENDQLKTLTQSNQTK